MLHVVVFFSHIISPFISLIVLFLPLLLLLSVRLNDVAVLDLKNNTWVTKPPTGTPPEGRSRASAVMTGVNKMLIFGGGCCGLGKPFFNDMYSYDPYANVWEQISASGTIPSKYHIQILI